MLKTNTIFKTIFILGLFILPTVSFAGPAGSYGEGYYDYDTSSGWGGDTYSYGYDYTPSYYDDTSSGWGGDTYSYGYDYTPSYSTPYYGGSGYSAPSYSGSSIGGYGYSPSYGGSYGSSYTPPSYSGSTLGGYTYSPSNATAGANANAGSDVTTVATGGNSSASASSSNTNINNNVNNVYVYTNPTGNAVVHNPEYQRVDGYCIITPATARTGQTVTATAYITGGIGSYTYTWGGDLASSASGVSTSFTSYNPGVKTITVTARSGQDVVTRSCNVTFENYVASYNYGSTVTTGTPVSGVYLQPGYTQVTTGTPVSGVYLNELPATGVDLNWMHYMIGFMIVVLATIATLISKSKKSFVGIDRE